MRANGVGPGPHADLSDRELHDRLARAANARWRCWFAHWANAVAAYTLVPFCLLLDDAARSDCADRLRDLGARMEEDWERAVAEHRPLVAERHRRVAARNAERRARREADRAALRARCAGGGIVGAAVGVVDHLALKLEDAAPSLFRR